MNKFKNKSKVLIIISLSLILFLFLGYKIIKNNKIKSQAKEAYIMNPSPNLDHKEFGEIKSIIEYGETSAIAVHYPLLGHKDIDKNIEYKIQNYIHEFKTLIDNNNLEKSIYKGELNIDYEIYNILEGIVSIKFTILENLPYYAHPNIKIDTTTYNLFNGVELKLKDIMKGEYLKEISQISMNYFLEHPQYKEYIDIENLKKGLAPIEKNYSNFILCDNHIRFIFQKYQISPDYLGTPEIRIPYKQIEDFIKPDFINEDSKETFSTNNDLDEIEIISNRNIDPDLPMVALTFDDGPYARTTIPILDTLKEHNSVATFFVLGNRVSRHKDIIKRIVEEGNEIGNHTYNHQQLTTVSSKEVKEQISRTQEAIIEVAGITPSIMRPTYGSYDNKLKSQVDMPMILWSIDTEDWKNRDPEKIVNHVLKNVQDGDIVLMHDIFPATAEAVEELVPALINRGFQLVTVSELYEIRGEALEVGNVYSHKR